jgi:hypothetical protein
VQHVEDPQMAVADKIIALLDTMTLASLDSLSPVRRRQFADICRHWADIAGRPPVGPSSAPVEPSSATAAVPESGRNMADALASAPSGNAVVGDAER